MNWGGAVQKRWSTNTQIGTHYERTAFVLQVLGVLHEILLVTLLTGWYKLGWRSAQIRWSTNTQIGAHFEGSMMEKARTIHLVARSSVSGPHSQTCIHTKHAET